MKRVVSVSLGSSRRDMIAELELAGEAYRIERRGTGGSLEEAARLLRELDGRVDAIGLGGINLAFRLGEHRYPLPEGLYLARQCRRTPVVDGAGWKQWVEPRAVDLLAGEVALRGRPVLVSSVLDRWELARAFQRAGARVWAGDPFYALGVPAPLPLPLFQVAALGSLWALHRIPIHRLYPLGAEQEKEKPAPAWLGRFPVLAGDFHFLRARLPRDLTGIRLLASTLTAEDVSLLRARGAAGVFAFNPPLGERLAGANLWEALAVAATGETAGDGPPRTWEAWLRDTGWRPHRVL